MSNGKKGTCQIFKKRKNKKRKKKKKKDLNQIEVRLPAQENEYGQIVWLVNWSTTSSAGKRVWPDRLIA